MSGRREPASTGTTKKIASREAETPRAENTISRTRQAATTGLGPRARSAMPPSQAPSAPTTAARMPKTPMSTTDHPSTPAA